ncbi:DUF402 domain-containing protein [Candidatus Mycoplasma haematominutum]|uniref:DUF402 domain-containing protein n=1 Tax=Candidatus Mycoplasma haematominutum 'Birmingham 1' TaxID=1116213 RepID=G8C3A0_9MOLU|nr:DUF402 domain-containing protein [Candidatus Mycoplasma haematominutum]CCE66798.1 conserved hypothetical protein (RNAse G and Eassociated domain containing protein) [Candidatus Mycoplasma haematominutum 'Birmingham 1']
MNKNKRQLMIHVYKQDANLFKTIEKHYCIFENPSLWVFFLPPFKAELIKEVVDSGGEREKFYKFRKYSVSTNRHPIFLFFWREHWFNLSLTLKPEKRFTLLLKISSPPIVEENTLKFIDFDLSLKLTDSRELSLLNSEDHILNCTKFKYSQNLQKQISKTIRTVFKLLKNNWFDTFTSEEFISSLWAQVTTLLGKTQAELLVKKEDKNTIERLEIDEFE